MDSRIVLTKKNPHDKSNIVSKIWLTYMFKLFREGYRRQLTTDDLYKPREDDRSGGLGDEMEVAWDEEQARARATGGRPSLGRCIFKVFWLRYMLWGMWVGLLFVFLWPLLPYTLSLFIAYFSSEKTAECYKYAHVYSFLLNALSIGTAVMVNHVNLGQSVVGMQVRVACCSLVYRKILKLNHVALGKTTSGHIVNLLSNDVQRFDMAAIYLHYLWVMPIVVPVVSYLVFRHIGWAVLAGLAVILMQTVLVQAYLSHQQALMRGRIARRTDERVRIMNELVNGVQVIKMYAWEKPFEKLVAKLRKMEVDLILKTSMIKGFSIALMIFTERVILFAAIFAFVLTGGVIRAEVTFAMVQYFNLLQLACNIFFPMALASMGEANVSVKRIEEFLTLEEREPQKSIPPLIPNGTEKVSKLGSLVLSHASATWSPDPIASTLRNINLKVEPGEFLGIAGPVGSGKSSMLHVILGELPLSKGSMSLGGATVSYASQEPWLFVASVRQNILFGQPYDPVRYKKVATACALLRDFELLPSGDMTMVGERGISLSGGQRARIGLARACYRKADVYLLDDPLSAVDTHVGKQLVSDCVRGLLRHSTRILVTHQLHHLAAADRLIVLRNGEIESQGSFEEVSKTPLFSELMQEDEEHDPELVSRVGSKPRLRSMSIQSETDSVLPDAAVEEEEEPNEDQELVEKGRVKASIYRKYFRMGGSWFLLLLTIFSFILAQTITSGSDLWLTHWMGKIEEVLQPQSLHLEKANLSEINSESGLFEDDPSEFTTTEASGDSFISGQGKREVNNTVMGTIIQTAAVLVESSKYNDVDHMYYLMWWFVLLILCMLVTTERSLLFLWVCMRASRGLHNMMFGKILRATMRFFDTNPSGRILNRFSKDIGTVDELMPRMMLEGLQVFMVMLGILVMVAIVSPYMILTTAVCAVIMYLMTVVFLSTAQAVKRLEGVTRSPVFSHVTATMTGLSTLRACRAQDMLRDNFDVKQDVHSGAWYLVLVSTTTFSIWLSMVSASYVIVVTYTFLLMDDGTTQSGHVGLAISQALIMVNMVQHGIRMVTEVISQMISVERIVQYMDLPQESPIETPPGKRPEGEWPSRARVVIRELYLRYEQDGEPVLKNLNVVIESGWKVGVVGRTGAGKSSLILALFRLAVLDGDIIIDEVNTADLGLKDLRSKISIIPQEPVLFSASLRYNLDPFDKHSDDSIWKALEQVELKQSVTSLSSMVTEGGGNFSAGQRQLLCLARAILNNNKILVLDEATANVDPKTDTLIQQTIRTAFSHCTVITVAHRLHTVADSDRILVMDAGQAVQYAHPHVLLKDGTGTFAEMVNQLGPTAAANLKEISAKAYDKHIQFADAD